MPCAPVLLSFDVIMLCMHTPILMYLVGGHNCCELKSMPSCDIIRAGVSYTMYKKYLVKSIFKEYFSVCQDIFLIKVSFFKIKVLSARYDLAQYCVYMYVCMSHDIITAACH